MTYEPDSYMGLHVQRFAEFYKPGVLQPDTHWRLVENAVEYAQDAGIRTRDIALPLSDVCTSPMEISFVSELALRRGYYAAVSGLYYPADTDPPIVDRLRAIVGALVRNFVPSRLIMQSRFFDLLVQGNDFDDYAVLCIPDLFRLSAQVPDGLRRRVGSFLLDRYIAEQQVCFGRLPQIKNVAADYGSDVADLIENRFALVEV